MKSIMRRYIDSTVNIVISNEKEPGSPGSFRDLSFMNFVLDKRIRM